MHDLVSDRLDSLPYCKCMQHHWEASERSKHLGMTPPMTSLKCPVTRPLHILGIRLINRHHYTWTLFLYCITVDSVHRGRLTAFFSYLVDCIDCLLLRTVRLLGLRHVTHCSSFGSILTRSCFCFKRCPSCLHGIAVDFAAKIQEYIRHSLLHCRQSNSVCTWDCFLVFQVHFFQREVLKHWFDKATIIAISLSSFFIWTGCQNGNENNPLRRQTYTILQIPLNLFPQEPSIVASLQY